MTSRLTTARLCPPSGAARLLPGLGLFLGTVIWAPAADWQLLLDNSPYGGPAAAAALETEPQQGQLEFRGVVEEDGAYLVSLYDPATKRAQWVPVAGQVPGLAVDFYDEQNARVVVTQNGRQITLPLARSKVALLEMQPAQPAAAANPPQDQQERLMRVAEEVRRRRALREQMSAGSGGPGGPGGRSPEELRNMIEQLRRARESQSQGDRPQGGGPQRGPRGGRGGGSSNN